MYINYYLPFHTHNPTGKCSLLTSFVSQVPLLTPGHAFNGTTNRLVINFYSGLVIDHFPGQIMQKNYFTHSTVLARGKTQYLVTDTFFFFFTPFLENK